MPDDDLPSPEPPPPEQPTLLGGVSPDEMLARGMQSVKMTSGTAGTWQPPTVEEAARLFPGYEVLRLLGRGGMGAVYQARQIELDRLVAIKLLPLEISVDKDFADRFRREARAMAKLNHPHIITVYDFGTTREGHLFFVMEFVEGANLADIIHQVGLTGDQALSIVEQVCTALAYAHGKGIVHRDIKPANVMIDTESHVKVADFGLARLTDPSAEQYGHTMTGTVMGTPDYMAPEQMKGMNVDHRADIYSLGVMVYEMLCREVPRGAFEPPSVRSGCDPRIDPIVIKAMQPNPERRYQSTQEMKSDVTAARAPVLEPPSAAPAGMSKPLPPSPKPVAMKAIPPPSPKKSKLLLYGGIAAAVALALGALLHFAPRKKSDSGGARVVVPQTSAGGGGKSVGADGASPSTATKDAPFVNTLAMKFVPVPDTQVLMCVHETRRKDYRAYADAVAGVDETWKHPAWDGQRLEQTDDHPVVMVSYEDATAFCTWLSKKEGRTYRLPTEREWNFAVVTGVDHPESLSAAELKTKLDAQFPWGTNKEADASKYGNYQGAGDGYEGTAPVMSFLPNALGIYDLGGNAWEWCQDWLDGTQRQHVLRGCGYRNFGPYRKSSTRELAEPNFRIPPPKDTNRRVPGFRCVVEKSSTPGKVGADHGSTPAGSPVAATTAPDKTTRDAPFVNTLGMKFVPVPILGGPTGGQRVLFSVWDTRVQDYEVFAKETKREWPKADFEQGPTHPAVNVSWDDATAFCAWLTAREGAAGRLHAGFAYRLPSDYEWSCAVGLGAAEDAESLPSQKDGKNSDVFPWGVQWPPPEKAGNFASEELLPLQAEGKYLKVKGVIAGYHDGYANTSPVGAYAANRFGLYDMSGNVQQWCADWCDADKKDRVLRGSAWIHSGRGNLLSSYRFSNVPALRNSYYGFRCVLAPKSAATNSTTAAERWIDLLSLVDVKRDEVQGTWSKKPEGLALESSYKFGVCELPYEPPEEYDFVAEFTPTSDGNNVNFHLRAGGASFLWKINAHHRTPPIHGLDLLDGKFMPSRTEAVVTNPLHLEIGQRYSTQVEVRRSGLRASVNGSEIFQWSGDYHRLTAEADAQLRDPRVLGIGSYGRTVIFHKVAVREISGAGHFTVETAPAGSPNSGPAPAAH